MGVRTARCFVRRVPLRGLEAVRPSGGFAVDEALALRQFLVQLAEVGVAAAPVDLREAEIQVAQRAAYGDVGQTEIDARAKRLLAQPLAHRLGARMDLG